MRWFISELPPTDVYHCPVRLKTDQRHDQHHQSQFVYIAGFMIGLSALMAFILSRKISDPLKQLNADARKFAEGRYDVEFKGGVSKKWQNCRIP